MSDLHDQADAALDAAAREDCLTIKEFAALVRMSESAIREAIRHNRLDERYRPVRITRKTWRIYVRKAA